MEDKDRLTLRFKDQILHFTEYTQDTCEYTETACEHDERLISSHLFLEATARTAYLTKCPVVRELMTWSSPTWLRSE
eukprot:4834002-Prymnesium_polylepis.1